MSMTHTIAISNHKGGVAKTTTCLSLGACLAEMSLRTLVVDLDPQADLTLSVGLDADELKWTMADLLEPVVDGTWTGSWRESPPVEVIQPTGFEGLDILPADPRLASIERFLYDLDDYEMILAQILSAWQEGYDYILLDCPPSLGAYTLMGLTAAQNVLIPIQCEYFAARRLERLLEVVDAVQERTNPGLSCLLLATMYDKRNRICRSVLEKLRINFPERLFETVIGVDTRLRESPALGEPIILYAPRTRASRQYRQLAHELHQKTNKGEEQD